EDRVHLVAYFRRSGRVVAGGDDLPGSGDVEDPEFLALSLSLEDPRGTRKGLARLRPAVHVDVLAIGTGGGNGQHHVLARETTQRGVLGRARVPPPRRRERRHEIVDRRTRRRTHERFAPSATVFVQVVDVPVLDRHTFAAVDSPSVGVDPRPAVDLVVTELRAGSGSRRSQRRLRGGSRWERGWRGGGRGRGCRRRGGRGVVRIVPD